MTLSLRGICQHHTRYKFLRRLLCLWVWIACCLVSSTVALASESQSDSQQAHLLPVFRPPNASELAAALAATAPLVWSAHQPADALLVVANETLLGVACLLEGDINSDSLELSWTLEDPATAGGLRKRHTLTSSSAASLHQTFSLDLGPGFRPATGVFHQATGSVLNLAFPTPMPGALSVGCTLRFGGAVTMNSARLRLWDERPVVAALVDSQSTSGGLDCQRRRHQLPTLMAVTLNCSLPVSHQHPVALLLETAVYAVHSCREDTASAWRLQSNVSEPADFYAIFNTNTIHIGWTLQSNVTDGADDICLSADAALPSGSRQLHLSWRLRINASPAVDAKNSNATIVSDSSVDGVFVLQNFTPKKAVSIDYFEEPPVIRALPCPYLCSAAAAGTAACRFSWLHAPNRSDSDSYAPPDPAIGCLPQSHRLLLLPWQPPGNPGPPPLSGAWVCRSAASLSGEHSSPLSQLRVQVATQPSLCGNQPPLRSIVFVPRYGSPWSAHQSLALNCSVCGLNEHSSSAPASPGSSKMDAQISIHGSIGVEASAVSLKQPLAGGGAELSLLFTQFRLPGDNNASTDGKDVGGSVIVRCRAVNHRGHGIVTFSIVEALPEPSHGAALDADCTLHEGRLEDSSPCRRFRCPLEPRLAAELPRLGIAVAYLFTLHPADGSPPQQTLSSGEQLETDTQLARLRCTQLLYYAQADYDNYFSGMDVSIKGRRQRFVAKDAATAAAHRAALGERRYSQLLLAVESAWLEVFSLPVPASARSNDGSVQGDAANGKRSSAPIWPRDTNRHSSTWVQGIALGSVVMFSALMALLFIGVRFQSQIIRGLRYIKGHINKEQSSDSEDSNLQTLTMTGSSSASSKAPKGTEAQKKEPDKKATVAIGLDGEANRGGKKDGGGAKSTKTVEKPTQPKPNIAASHNQSMAWLGQHQWSPQQQLWGLISSSSTVSTRPTPTTPSSTQTIKALSPTALTMVDLDDDGGGFHGGSSVVMGFRSPTVMSWGLSEEESLVGHRQDALLMSTSSSQPAPGPVMISGQKDRCFQVCEATDIVTERGMSVSSARVLPASCCEVATGSGLVSTPAAAAVATATLSSRARPAVRLRLRERPQLLTIGSLHVAADQNDFADSDSDKTANLNAQAQRVLALPEATVAVAHSQWCGGGRSAELSRLERCLVCQPPRFRLAAGASVGVEISASNGSATDTTTTTSTSASFINEFSVTIGPEKASSNEEVDVPPSESQLPALPLPAPGRQAQLLTLSTATLSTTAAIVEVAESTVRGRGLSRYRRPSGNNAATVHAEQQVEEIDGGSTCTGTECCSTDSDLEIAVAAAVAARTAAASSGGSLIDIQSGIPDRRRECRRRDEGRRVSEALLSSEAEE